MTSISIVQDMAGKSSLDINSTDGATNSADMNSLESQLAAIDSAEQPAVSTVDQCGVAAQPVGVVCTDVGVVNVEVLTETSSRHHTPSGGTGASHADMVEEVSRGRAIKLEGAGVGGHDALDVYQEHVLGTQTAGGAAECRTNGAVLESGGQRYVAAWENEALFKDWIKPHPTNDTMAWCKACNRNLYARRTDITKHAASRRHLTSMEFYQKTGSSMAQSRIGANYRYNLTEEMLQDPRFRDWLRPVPNNRHRAWCMLCACYLLPVQNALLSHFKCRKHERNYNASPTLPPTEEDVEAEIRDTPIAAAGGANGPSEYVDTSLQFGPDGTAIRQKRRYIRRQHMSTGSGGSMGVAATPPDNKKRCRSPLLESDFAGRVTFAIGLGHRTVGFLGAGQMAQAMAKGMLEQGLLSPSDLMVSAPSNKNMSQWRRWKCIVTNDNNELIQHSDIIFIAVKASALTRMIEALSPVQDTKMRLFVSVIPGVCRQRVYELLTTRIVPVELESEEESGKIDYSLHVVRCAPNRMMAMGTGFCSYCMEDDLPHSLYLVLETIFSSLGTCVQADESLIDSYSTALQCGAAFTCAFVDSLVHGTVNLDVPWDEALKVATCVVLGTSKMLLQSGVQPNELSRSICTPGSSAIMGLAALHHGGLDDTVVCAMDAACRKTSENGSVI